MKNSYYLLTTKEYTTLLRLYLKLREKISSDMNQMGVDSELEVVKKFPTFCDNLFSYYTQFGIIDKNATIYYLKSENVIIKFEIFASSMCGYTTAEITEEIPDEVIDILDIVKVCREKFIDEEQKLQALDNFSKSLIECKRSNFELDKIIELVKLYYSQNDLHKN